MDGLTNMARKKKNGDQPIGVGLTSKQMKRKKPINADMLRDVEALTDNQKALFESYAKNKNLVAYGAEEQVRHSLPFTML